MLATKYNYPKRCSCDGLCILAVDDAICRHLHVMSDKGDIKSMLLLAKMCMAFAATREGDDRIGVLLDAFFHSKRAAILGRLRFRNQVPRVLLTGGIGAAEEHLDANVNISLLDPDLIMAKGYDDCNQRAEESAFRIINSIDEGGE